MIKKIIQIQLIPTNYKCSKFYNKCIYNIYVYISTFPSPCEDEGDTSQDNLAFYHNLNCVILLFQRGYYPFDVLGKGWNLEIACKCKSHGLSCQSLPRATGTSTRRRRRKKKLKILFNRTCVKLLWVFEFIYSRQTFALSEIYVVRKISMLMSVLPSLINSIYIYLITELEHLIVE